MWSQRNLGLQIDSLNAVLGTWIILYPAVEAAKTCPTIDWKGVLSFQEVSPDG
jgi:hypothetical protein